MKLFKKRTVESYPTVRIICPKCGLDYGQSTASIVILGCQCGTQFVVDRDGTISETIRVEAP